MAKITIAFADRKQAEAIASILSPQGYEIFRIGGDEFLVITTDISEEDFNALVESLRKKTKESEKFKLAIGSCYAGNDPDIRQAMKRADKEMYKDKEAYYSSI